MSLESAKQNNIVGIQYLSCDKLIGHGFCVVLFA